MDCNNSYKFRGRKLEQVVFSKQKNMKFALKKSSLKSEWHCEKPDVKSDWFILLLGHLSTLHMEVPTW